MATKAERFRYAAERSRPPRPKRRQRQRDDVDTSHSGVSASDRRAGGTSTGLRNLSRARKAVFALEDARAPAPPSRKSTRKSKNRQKAGAPLKARELIRAIAPSTRHERG